MREKQKPDWFGLGWFFGLPILAVISVIAGKSLDWKLYTTLLMAILTLWAGGILWMMWRYEK